MFYKFNHLIQISISAAVWGMDSSNWYNSTSHAKSLQTLRLHSDLNSQQVAKIVECPNLTESIC